MKNVLVFIIIICLVIAPFIPWVHSIVKDIEFDANCSGYLALAADAPNIDIAEKHLATAIDYLEKNDLTHGHTNILIYRPGNDIGLWYDNLKSAHEQLKEMQATKYTELEESNTLMKLREVILTNEGNVTHPEGISMAGYYKLMFWLNILLWLPCWLIAGILGVCVFDDWY